MGLVDDLQRARDRYVKETDPQKRKMIVRLGNMIKREMKIRGIKEDEFVDDVKEAIM